MIHQHAHLKLASTHSCICISDSVGLQMKMGDFFVWLILKQREGVDYSIIMNFTGGSLSEGCIRQLYTSNRCEAKHPCLQILDFEESEVNEKEIIMRITDGTHFIDCTLFGNYQISNNAIIETKNATTVTTFRRLQIVKLIDYFSKIDDNRITKLKIIIRKMNDTATANQQIGYPQEIHQYMVNAKGALQPNTDKTTKKIRVHMEANCAKPEQNNIIKIESPMDTEMPAPYHPTTALVQKSAKRQPGSQSDTQQNYINSNYAQSNGQGLTQSLTLRQILSGKEGFLIARLVRLKCAKKATKEDNVMTVCYLGLVDRHSQLIRVHLAGRIAMNNEKTLKKNKSYFIRGFDLVNLKNAGTQIRLKEKEYKIVEIHNQELTKHLPYDYYSWDHERHESQAECQFVDVIGVIDDIEQKATYTVDTKSVIRVVLKNKFKSIRISFWTDQMKNLQNFNLKKKECIIIEDIRKKQGKYYDFSLQSTLINLAEFPFIKEKFQGLFPQVVELGPPQNISQLERLYRDDPNNSTLQTIKAYLISFKDSKLIYYICDDCKKKVEKNASQCQQCASSNLVYKYNCPLQFSDCTGSIVVVLFDAAAQKLIGKTANQINQMSEQAVEHLFEGLLYRYYMITVQHRNQRVLLRNIESIDQNQQVTLTRQNIDKIYLNSQV